MRPDGIRVHDEDPMYDLIPQFLAHRYDAMNMVTVDIPMQPLHDYMNQKRHEKQPVSHLALIVSAYGRVAQEFPKLNRFISGSRKLFQHKNFTVSMVVMRPDSEGSAMSKFEVTAEDTIFTIQDKITSYISTNRQANANSLDKWMKRLVRIGGLVQLFGIAARFLDKHGLLPRSLCEASPFHASLLISNLASIRVNHIYHHVYEFGTTSVAITMGNPRMVARESRGDVVFDKCIPLGVVMDERIASGQYFGQAFARLKRYLAHPELLEQPFGQPLKEAKHAV